MGAGTGSNEARLEQVRRATRDVWEAMAPGWERQREYLKDFSRPVTEWLVANLDPGPGQTILELGAGTGETGFAAAGLLGEDGRLISSDLPPAMVEVAKRRAQELGIGNAEFRVIDAERIPLEDDSVDGAVCRWAYMLMPDPAAAMAETRRVLRPGGRLAAAVMAGPAENPWGSRVAMAISGLGLTPPSDPKAPGGLFSLADHDLLRGMLTGAGFADVGIEEVGFRLRFTDFDDYWRFVSEFAGAVAILIRSFTDDQQDAVREATRKAMEEFRTGQGLDVPGLSVNAVAS